MSLPFTVSIFRFFFFSLSSFRIECMMIYSYYNGKLIILTEWKWTTIYNWMYLFEHAHFNLCLLHCRWKTKKWKSVTYEQINFFLFYNTTIYTKVFSVMVLDLNSNWAGTDNGSDQFHVKVRWERGELSTPDGDE